jgi:hypothetical protein
MNSYKSLLTAAHKAGIPVVTLKVSKVPVKDITGLPMKICPLKPEYRMCATCGFTGVCKDFKEAT